MKTVREKRSDIQLYRAVAIIAVVFGHIFPGFFSNGYLGVDVFFVISGFLVTQSILTNYAFGMNKWRAIFTFLHKRILRLTPALLIVFTLSTPFIFLVSNPSDLKRIALQGLSGLVFLGNIGANRYQGSYFQPELNPWLHTWSLGVEFQSYILLAIFGVLLAAKRFKIVLVSILVASFSVFLFSAENSLSLMNDYYSFFSRLWEVVAGSLAYVYKEDIKRSYGRLFESILMSLAVMIMFSPIQIERKQFTEIIVVIMMLLLTSQNQKTLSRSNILSTFIGDRAYSIYLVHLPFFYVLERMPVTNLFMENSLFKIAIFAPLLFLSDKLYTRVEIRFQGQIVYQFKKSFKFIILTAVNVLLTCFMTMPMQLNGNEEKNFKTEVWFQSQRNQVFGDINSPMSSPRQVTHNAASKEKWLLLGDSHAAMFYTALSQKAQKVGANLFVFTQYGCPYFNNTTIGATSTGARNCIARNIKARAWIKREQPKFLITASRPGYVLDGLKINQDSLLKEEQMTLINIKNTKVLRLGPVPYVYTQKSLAKKIFNRGYNADLAKIPEIQNRKWKSFSEISNIAYVDMYSIMCISAKNCEESLQIKKAYFDDNHLTRIYAEDLFKNANIKMQLDRMFGTRDRF